MKLWKTLWEMWINPQVKGFFPLEQPKNTRKNTSFPQRKVLPPLQKRNHKAYTEKWQARLGLPLS